MARRGSGWGRKEAFVKPDGQIRRSQIVTTFGPGAMVDLVDSAVLVGGLDFWSYAPQQGAGGMQVLHEERLREAIARMGKALDMGAAFREPPAGDDRDPSRNVGVKVLEFPQWFVCQDPRCRALQRAPTLERKRGQRWHPCATGSGSKAVPVRFVYACPKGHIEDVDWKRFAHRDRPVCAAPSLQLIEGATGDYSEIKVRCACGAEQSLAGALVQETQPPCSGERPWLGPMGREECDQRLRLLVRTASNSYFPQQISALSVPNPATELRDAVERHWKILKVATTENLPAFRQIPEVKDALGNFDDASVLAAVDAIKNDAPMAQDPLRTAELKQFLEQPEEKPGEQPGDGAEFFARRCAPNGGLPRGVSGLVLAQRLREVLVQVGFTRIAPKSPDLQGEYDLRVESADLGLSTSWLPAIEIHGEGVLVQLDEQALHEWEQRPAVVERTTALLKGYEMAIPAGDGPPFPGARFYLLHSLSHLLIHAISLECGYSASALRERIYCSSGADDMPMGAVLLSTGTSGSEGTLGGLVEQGRRLRTHLRRAWELGQLCSSDPVCAAHSPEGDKAERYFEGAACHGCMFIAECSCERFNRYLDRALVVPTIGHRPELAFFRERP